MQYLTKGKRGRVFLTEKVTVVKKAASYRVQNEVGWLRLLNKNGIGPRLISAGEDWFEMELITGDLLEDYLRKVGGKQARKILKDCLKQCRVMDRLKMNKQEMHHPVKHILVVEGKPVFIDFERCKITEHPKNVTQFCQYLLKLAGMFPGKIEIDTSGMIEAMKGYKREQSEKNFNKILKLV